jgi:hypothetical protein
VVRNLKNLDYDMGTGGIPVHSMSIKASVAGLAALFLRCACLKNCIAVKISVARSRKSVTATSAQNHGHIS